MKLRNKKTEEIIEAYSIQIHLRLSEDGRKNSVYTSLAELNEEWEDYKSAEPLIKDEKVRKIIRSWAHVNNVDKVEYNYYSADDNCSFIFTYDGGMELLLDFRCKIDNLISGKTYTIPELCGKEEEC